jgi:hypothetical protein
MNPKYTPGSSPGQEREQWLPESFQRLTQIGLGTRSRSFHLSEQFEQCLSRASGRRRVLAREKSPIHDRMRSPIAHYRKDGSQPQRLILDEERHDVRQLHRFHFAVGETRHVLAVHERLAIVG